MDMRGGASEVEARELAAQAPVAEQTAGHHAHIPQALGNDKALAGGAKAFLAGSQLGALGHQIQAARGGGGAH